MRLEGRFNSRLDLFTCHDLHELHTTTWAASWSAEGAGPTIGALDWKLATCETDHLRSLSLFRSEIDSLSFEGEKMKNSKQ